MPLGELFGTRLLTVLTGSAEVTEVANPVELAVLSGRSSERRSCFLALVVKADVVTKRPSLC